MAAYDISIYKTATKTDVVPKRCVVAAGATTINPGEPVARALGAVSVTAMATGKPVVGADYVVGIAVSKSTQTASEAGEVYVAPLVPGNIYLISPATLASWDTQAEYDALVGKRVTIAISSGSYVLNATDGATNGCVVESVLVTDPQINRSKVAFSFRWGVSDLS